MKGKVFLAWSGTDELAKEVKACLGKKHYMGIVGGETKPEGLFVNEVILHEMKLGRDPQIQGDGKVMTQHSRAFFKPEKCLLKISHAGKIHGCDL